MIFKTTRKPEPNEVIGQVVNVVEEENGIVVNFKLDEGVFFPDMDIVICRTCGDKWDTWHADNIHRISWWAHWRRGKKWFK